MIDDLLDLAALEAGSVPLRRPACLSTAPVEAVIDLMRPQAQAAGVALGRWMRSGLVVMADATRVRQVLINLVGNAIQYNAAEGRVELLLEPVAGSPPTVGIVVRDDGPGIAPERQHLLFQPFNRLGAQGGVVPGHGLGLAISAAAGRGDAEARSSCARHRGSAPRRCCACRCWPTKQPFATTVIRPMIRCARTLPQRPCACYASKTTRSMRC